MSTPAQILANRENAQHSTGPKSQAGKATSSLNNLQHGLAARGFIVLPGQETAFSDLEAGLRANLSPTGQLQETIFLRLLEAAWNLHRCRLATAQLYLKSPNPELDPLLDDQLEAKHARIQKYAKQHEHSFRKSFQDMSRIQTELQYRAEAFPLTEEQRNDDELFNQTPHSCSVAVEFADVMDTFLRQEKQKTQAAAVAERAEREQAIDNMKLMIERITAPPRLTGKNFQFEPNPRIDAA